MINYFFIFKKVYKVNTSYKKINTLSVSDFFISRIANYFITILVILKIKPNYLTIFNYFVGLFAICIIFFEGIKFIDYATYLFVFHYIIDNSDGGLARFYKKKTFYGKLLDSMSDTLFKVFFYTVIFFGFFKINYDYNIFFYNIVGSIFILLDIFILDKFSSLVRWCNVENKNKFPPYIRRQKFSRIFFVFQDIIFFSTILLPFFKENTVVFLLLIIIISTAFIASGFFNLAVHLFYGYKFLNFKKK
jgi:phosphatidylglycerophosphate synthase